MMCKVNVVTYVKGKMSREPARLSGEMRLNKHHKAMHSGRYAQKELDINPLSDIIVFTDGYGRFAQSQTHIPPAAGRFESATRERAARKLSKQRVLRSGRLAAGQVRDAAPSRSRQATGQPGGQNVWLLSTVVLSGPGGFSGVWSRRSVATQAGTAIRTQAGAETDAVCGTTATRRAGDLHSPTGRPNRKALRYLGSPAQHRPSTTASKKTPVSPESAAVRFSDRRLVTAYEDLRSQAAQGRQQGPGLALMIARGFRSWMETCSQLFTTECSRTPISDRLEPSMPSGLRGEVVLLLVSMMLHRVSKEVV
jgi:hypothetical protein